MMALPLKNKEKAGVNVYGSRVNSLYFADDIDMMKTKSRFTGHHRTI